MRYYLDTEFDGFGGELISLALVRSDGASRYYVFREGAADPWVRQNVIPILDDCPPMGVRTDARNAAMDIANFLEGDADPVIITDWPADIRYFCQLIEFPRGKMAPIAGLRFELCRVDAYPSAIEDAVQHNAWWDAVALGKLLEPLAP